MCMFMLNMFWGLFNHTLPSFWNIARMKITLGKSQGNGLNLINPFIKFSTIYIIFPFCFDTFPSSAGYFSSTTESRSSPHSLSSVSSAIIQSTRVIHIVWLSVSFSFPWWGRPQILFLPLCDCNLLIEFLLFHSHDIVTVGVSQFYLQYSFVRQF